MTISHCDSAFVVWNTLTSPKLQTINFVKKESSGDKADQACFMAQGNDSLEVHLETHLDIVLVLQVMTIWMPMP